MNNTYTQGQWNITKHATPDYAPQYGIYADGNGHDHVIVTGPNARADAQLIVTAPALLEVCKAALERLQELGYSEKEKGLLRTLYERIARAEGRT